MNSEPVGSPTRTMAKPKSSSEATSRPLQLPDSETIPLPGTPVTDHIAADHDISDSTCDPPASWCGSSVSSEVSVKSTDALIVGKN